MTVAEVMDYELRAEHLTLLEILVAGMENSLLIQRPADQAPLPKRQ